MVQMTPRGVMLAILAGGGVILLIVAISVGVSSSYSSPHTTNIICPQSDYTSQPPLIIVSMDGFRASYLARGLTPVVQGLVNEGVSVPYMKPSYPTVTFPNHYTIITGLYPESHGIIANKFYDPELERDFSLSNGATKEGVWWGGEPLWNTLTSQGKKSATFFWPGSDAPIGGTYPTYYYDYNSSVAFEDRVDQVLDWVSLPEEDRPALITLYFNEPDHTGHEFGPDSDEVTAKLAYVDSMIGRLLEGLKSKNIYDCVNLIVVADHGMAGGGPSWVIDLKEYIPDLYDRAFVYGGAFSRIRPKEYSEDEVFDIMSNLSCRRPDMREYEKKGLPTRFHFSNNKRIEDIVLDVDAGRYVSTSYFNLGNHGYDNYVTAMNALFVARGPDFKTAYKAEPFQNVELYNLMSYLTKVTPAPNNGTWGSLNHLLANPPDIIELPEEVPLPSPVFPDSSTVIGRLDLSGCDGDLTTYQEWMSTLNITDADKELLEETHIPWGTPRMDQNGSDNMIILHHLDHITGYSEDLKLTLWTSFTIATTFQSTEEADWSSDVRLDETNTAKCSDFTDFIDGINGTVLAPLFSPVFSSNSSLSRIPYLISNAVPSTVQQQDRWQQLMEVHVERWLAFSELNIVAGPVYDNNADSHFDNVFESGTNSILPSDWFAVITRCTSGGHIKECTPENLDSRAFIYPTVQTISNCLNLDQYALEFSSTIRDVTKITGFTFYPALGFENRTKLEVTVHPDIW